MTRRRRLLDLFCGQGGAAMGYHRAGFDVVGVDLRAQPRYPFPFVKGDALEYVAAHGHDFDAIHASPPCQRYSRLNQRGRLDHYPDLLDPTRIALRAAGRPWVIENVPLSPIRAQLLLCGSMFGLDVQRHRYFEGDWSLPFPPVACSHGIWPGGHPLNIYSSGARRRGTERGYVDAMGVPWATAKGGRESIPPAYAEWVGAALIAECQAAA